MSEASSSNRETLSNSTKAKSSNETSSSDTGKFSTTTESGCDNEEGHSPDLHPPLDQAPSYFSLSSGSSFAMSPPTNAVANKSVIDNPGIITPGNETQGGRRKIESSAEIPPMPSRKDSDDFSYTQIKPVHNFFGQHPIHPYDSDGSDGSLVFSPVSDGSMTRENDPTGSTIGQRSDPNASNPSRTRFGSVDSAASNGSIHYVRPSPATVNAPAQTDTKQTAGQPRPINPQMLPYNERRKLVQQRQYQEQYQQYQQYHAAMMHAHSQASQHKQGHSSHPPVTPYAIDPRMAGSYYQMYGMPPPGIYGLPPPHGQQHPGGVPVNGYPFLPPQPGIPYHPVPNSVGTPHNPSQTQLHPSIQQFQHHNPATGYQQQPYPPPFMPGPQVPPQFPSPHLGSDHTKTPPATSPHQSMLPQIPYLPPAPPLSTSDPSDQARQQEKETRKDEEPQKQLQSQDTPVSSAVKGGNSTQLSSSSGVTTNTKNHPTRLPHTATRRGSGGGAPPLPSPLPQSNVIEFYERARTDSHGSMSSLGSQGIGSGSFQKDEGNDCLPPSTHTGTDSRKDSNSSTQSTPKSIRPNVEKTPETPQQTSHTRKSTFLDMLRMNWSPQSRNSTENDNQKKLNVSEFHRKNQEFLSRATTLPPIQKSSPVLPGMHHRRVGSHDRPPASRGTHRRLRSISNDEWDDDDADKSSDATDNAVVEAEIPSAIRNSEKNESPTMTSFKSSESDGISDSGAYTDEDRFTTDEDDNVNEFSSLLPPSGISTNEQEGKNQKYDRKNRRGRQNYESTSNTTGESSNNEPTLRWDNRAANAARKTRKKKYRYKNSKHTSNISTSSSSESSDNSSDEDFDHRKWTKKRARMLEKERTKLIKQWKAEAREEAELLRKEEEFNRWYRRWWRTASEHLHRFGVSIFRCLTWVENFIGNLPLTIGAVALAIVTLGVVWFKFAEEYLDTCERVHFHSSQCTFPEFPGCFYCDKKALGYKIAIDFHYLCTSVSGLLATLVVAKILLATRVVVDEMSSPTTSSPAGLLCMTAVCVFAGRGLVGQVIVSTAACFHLALAIWFIYMALAYNIMPEPSWFPNTVGIGLSAVKTWLYYPMPGHLLMAISLSLNLCFFPISLIRVVANKKISATVAWMQMSAPAVSLYALTIMAQPSFEEEQPDVTNFQRIHRMIYLPCMHVMCALSLIGMAASLQSLYDRWNDFKRKEFSPAHAAFCFPTLSHANAIQSYRAAVLSFSHIPPRSWRMFILDLYWITVLVGGTIATFWICGKFLYKLPEWTSPDLSNEEEPPAPYETILSRQQMVTAGDTLTQSFVSPAILQANETGALILSRNAMDGTLRYVRTRRIRALGFEPTMNWSEIQEEEEKLLEWVGKHPPRRRHRTLSVPGIDFNYGSSQPAFGTGNVGVYGLYSPVPSNRRRSLSQGEESPFFK